MAVNSSRPPSLSLTVLDTAGYERLLKKLARTFSLSLRILPPSIRPSLSLAYMLARASDSIADASTAPTFQRLALLRALPDFYPEKSPDLGLAGDERDLVDRLPALLHALELLPDTKEIREAWRVILRGQIFDLERFESPAEGESAKPLEAAELEEYTKLVAGSVGEFWTRQCFRHVPGYSSLPLEEMLPLANRFGQALQFVNILRDRRRDADAGRIYIPDERFYPAMQQAAALLESGDAYCRAVLPRRLRAACKLPLDLARQTLALVAEHPLGIRVKVPRHKVWVSFAKAFLD
ncbi:MAG: squalene/phytoene synthase family protein [Verrucomicrobiota bacterium]